MLSGCPHPLGPPPTRSWCLGGGGVEVPCHRHPWLLAQPWASLCSHPRGLQSPSVGQMSRVGRCPALRALSARGSTREAAGPLEPGLCWDFFVQKWQKHLSLAYENQELTGIDLKSWTAVCWVPCWQDGCALLS